MLQAPRPRVRSPLDAWHETLYDLASAHLLPRFLWLLGSTLQPPSTGSAPPAHLSARWSLLVNSCTGWHVRGFPAHPAFPLSARGAQHHGSPPHCGARLEGHGFPAGHRCFGRGCPRPGIPSGVKVVGRTHSRCRHSAGRVWSPPGPRGCWPLQQQPP